MCARSSRLSASKTTTSSSRLRNSGLNATRTTAHDRLAPLLGRQQRVDEVLRPEVGGEHEDDVAEVDGAALAVGEPTVVEHLEQDVEGLRVRLLDLVEQDHRVGPAADRLGELAALLVADVARRRADEARDGVPLGVLRHVDADHGPLVVEEEVGERTWRARSCRHPSGRGRGSDPVGRSGSETPARVRRTASDTARTASVWPTRRAPMCCSMCSSFSVSPSSSRPAGMPVHAEMTSAMSSAPTSSLTIGRPRRRPVDRRRLTLLGRRRAASRATGCRRRGSSRRPRGRPRAGAGRPACAGRRCGP